MYETRRLRRNLMKNTTMSNTEIDPLFILIKSMSKSEKRYFKLFATRQLSNRNAKFLRLFDHIESQKEYDELKILRKDREIKAVQLPNLKAYLYKYILVSLRNNNPNDDLDIKIREKLDFAKILYNRCLFESCNKTLMKVKELVEKYDKNIFSMEITDLEKKLVTKIFSINLNNRTDKLIEESNKNSKIHQNISKFSNLWLRFYTYYLDCGFIRNTEDYEKAIKFLKLNMPVIKEDELSIDEKMYLFNSLIAYYFFIQDFHKAYSYSKKCLNLFTKNPEKAIPRLDFYVKSINNLLTAQSKLNKLTEFAETTKLLDQISKLSGPTNTLNIRMLVFKYSSIHKINRYFMTGSFSDGVKIIPEISKSLDNFERLIDDHYKLIFYYKFACMYFGNEDYHEANFWLNRIINSGKIDFRSDIQVFTRILSLICHYELENTEQMEYFMRSTYRFILKNESMQGFNHIILSFLRKMNSITADKLVESFTKLKNQLIPLSTDPFQKRAFIYFDSISWLESKIYNKPVQIIIKEKAEIRIRKAESNN